MPGQDATAEPPGAPPIASYPPGLLVSLNEDHWLDWARVSPALATTRRLVAVLFLAPPLIAFLIAGALSSRWFLVPAAVFLLLLGWLWWLIGRQVSAISYVELPEELVIRRGRMLRSLVSVPYGRLQFVDLSAGPLLQWKGLASLEIHTASPSTSGTIPGLPRDRAEALRLRLAAHGEAQRAGL